MKKLIVAMALLGILAVPALCEHGHEYGGDQLAAEMSMEEQRELREFQMEGEMVKIELEKAHLELDAMKMQIQHEFEFDDDDDESESIMAHGHILFLIILIIHILSAVWVYGDMKGKACASWIWVALALLGGLCATIAYAIVRLADCCHEKPEAPARRNQKK